jgi:hypothetical protein
LDLSSTYEKNTCGLLLSKLSLTLCPPIASIYLQTTCCHGWVKLHCVYVIICITFYKYHIYIYIYTYICITFSWSIHPL